MYIPGPPDVITILMVSYSVCLAQMVVVSVKHLKKAGMCDGKQYYFKYWDLSKYGKIRLTTGRIPVTVVTTPNVRWYGRQYPYDGAVHTAHTVYV